MSPRTILMLNVNETAADPRVRRISRSLAQAGHRVIAIGPNTDRPAREHTDGFEILRFPGPKLKRGAALDPIERRDPEAAAIIRQASPAVMDERVKTVSRVRRRLYRLALRQGQRLETISGRPWPGMLELIERIAPSDVKELMNIRSMMLINHQLAKAAADLRPDVVHANDLNTLLAGLIIKRRTGAQLVYDAHEIYPEQFPVDQRSELWHGFYTRLEGLLLPHTDARMTVCDSLGSYFVAKYAAGPFQTIRNVPSIRFLPPPEILDRRNEPREVLYHGAFFKYRGLEEIVRATRHLRRGRIVLRGFGYHEPALRALAAAEGAGDRLRFSPAVPVDQLVTAASEADVGLCPFPSSCLNTEYALPNKFFEYLMAGLAVASSDLVELRRMTLAHDVGILFASLEPAAIAEAIDALLADPDRLDHQRRRAYLAAKEELHWELEEQRLLELYRGL